VVDLWKSIVLGIVEGLTEFLPISSTGHLIVFGELLTFNGEIAETFEIFIQIGAVAAVIWYYRHEFAHHAREARRGGPQWLFATYILVAFLPAAMFGVLVELLLGDSLFSPTVVAISLIVGGIVFLLVECLRDESLDDESHSLSSLTMQQAAIIGFAQTFALIPGVSRSGASILGGMLAGLNRPAATRFSFYLALPTLSGATAFKLFTNLDTLNGNNIILLLVGAVVSAIVSWMAIGWLLRYISRNSFVPFGYYRIIAGIVILLFVA